MNTHTNLAVLTCTVDMHFAPADTETAVSLLLTGVDRTEAKSGCRSCSVSRDANRPDHVHYCETWNEEEAFRRHVKSTEFDRILAAMDLCAEEPRVVVGRLSGYSGISYLQELRGQNEAHPL